MARTGTADVGVDMEPPLGVRGRHGDRVKVMSEQG
jgi:hypothetical protein